MCNPNKKMDKGKQATTSAQARILVVGDMHFAERSILIVEKMKPLIIENIKKYKPDKVVFLGDTLDRFGTTTHVRSREAIDFFYEVSQLCPTILLIGNHDIPNKNDFMSANHGFTGMKYYWKNTTVVDTCCVEFEINGLIFQAVPYCPNGRLVDGLNTLEGRSLNGIAAIFCHQEIKNCDLDGMISAHGDEWDDSSPLLICGHIHKRQLLKDNVYYIGSPYQDKVDEYYVEPEDKGISLLTFTRSRESQTHAQTSDGIKWKERRIALNLPIKTKLIMTAKDYGKWEPEENYIYFITVHGTNYENSKHRGSDKTLEVAKSGGKVVFSNTGISLDINIKSHVKEQKSLFERMKNSIADKPHLQSIYDDVFNG